MTDDQVRVRVTVTVTRGDGRQGRRSSVVESVIPDKWDTLVNPATWLRNEAKAAYDAAWRAAEDAPKVPR